MKKTIFTILFTVAICTAMVWSYICGQKSFLVTEYKECQAHMLQVTQRETNQPTELKDYIKSRYYFLANRIPKNWVGQPVDYGSICTNIQHLAVFKGPSSGQSEYNDFLKRFELPQKQHD